jgi:glycosyltransferase involved in cell wall biosynthesis
MKINWFSPLPPSQTGVAEYSSQVLEVLAKHSEVTIWTDQEHWSPSLESFGEVRQFDRNPDWCALNEADATFYNIGNNAEFHAALWAISQRHAGVVILHDTHLQHLFVELYKRQLKKFGIYRAAMLRYHGQEGVKAANALLNGSASPRDLASRFPLTQLGLQNALAAVVHSPAAVDPISETGRSPVIYAPLPYRIGAHVRAKTLPTWRASHRQARPYQLIIFGYLGANRRLDAIVQALQSLPGREGFRLHIYGKLDKPNEWQRRFRNAKLDPLVHIHGFVPDAELDAALSQADLAINLRYPSMGEASWTQLRIWSHGLPSLVTKTGWYATLPAESVAFVRPENEVADLRQHLQRFLADPTPFIRQGVHGRKLLRDVHTPEKYVDTLLHVAAQAETWRGRVNTFRLVERTGEILGQFTSRQEHASMLTRIAQAIRRVAA